MPTTRWRLAPCGALIALAVLAHANGVTGPFLADDHAFVVGNPAVADPTLLLDGERIDALPVLPDLRNSIRSRPFAYLTFALNHRLGGEAPLGYHLVNVAVHAVNGVLVYLLAAGLLALSRRRAPGGAPGAAEAGPDWAALAVAALFVVHPLQTNAVAYVTQRFTSLVALLYLASVVAYLAGRRASTPRAAAGWLAASLLACAVAMKTKETAFTIPAALTLAELVFLEGPWRRRLATLVPFYATMVIIPATLWSAADPAGGVLDRAADVSALMNLDDTPRLVYLLTQPRVVVTYLRLLVLPAGLNFDRDFPVSTSLLEPAVLASLALLVALLSLGVHLLARARRSGPAGPYLRVAGFGVLWFFGTLSVTSSIIPINDVINEYRVYLPSVGFLLLAVHGTRGALEAWPRGRALLLGRGGAAALAGLIGALALATVARNEVWRDPALFWEDVVRKSPDNVRAAGMLSEVYLHRGMPEAAIEAQEAMIRRRPELGRPRFFLGSLYLRLGRLPEAVAELERARAVRDDKGEIHLALAQAYLGLGRLDDARAAVAALERLEPWTPELPGLRAQVAAGAELAP